jgi:hypothetical protein
VREVVRERNPALEVAEYIFGFNSFESRYYVGGPALNFFWFGLVVTDPWKSPGANYGVLNDAFDRTLAKKGKIKLPYILFRHYHLYAFYLRTLLIDFKSNDLVEIDVNRTHRFAVHYPMEYKVEEAKVMSLTATGGRRVEETLEVFKVRRLHLGKSEENR